MKKLVLIAALTAVTIFGVMASANAANEITVSATVNSRIVVTAPADHDFGPVDPGTGVYTHTGNVNVRSNVDYDLAVNGSGDTAVITDSGTIAGPYAKAPAAGGFDHVETWTLDSGDATSDWADPGLVSATFVYTATP